MLYCFSSSLSAREELVFKNFLPLLWCLYSSLSVREELLFKNFLPLLWCLSLSPLLLVKNWFLMDYSLWNLAALRWFMRIAAARSFLSSGKGLDPTCACKTHFFKGYSRSLSINQPREVSYQSVSAQLFSLGKAIFCPSGRMGYFWRSPIFCT